MNSFTTTDAVAYKWIVPMAVPEEPTDENIKPLLDLLIFGGTNMEEWVKAYHTAMPGISSASAPRSTFMWLDEAVRQIIGYSAIKYSVAMPNDP